jgi:hypothetical protein
VLRRGIFFVNFVSFCLKKQFLAFRIWPFAFFGLAASVSPVPIIGCLLVRYKRFTPTALAKAEAKEQGIARAACASLAAGRLEIELDMIGVRPPVSLAVRRTNMAL